MPTEAPPRPANAGRSVFVISLILCGAVAVWGIADSEGLSAAGTAFQETVLDALGWLVMGSVTAFLVLGIWLALSRYGRIRLGKQDSRPEFSTLSWLSMLFAAGMGVGLLFWGAAEPVLHYASPPVPPGGTPTAARQAMVQTLFHWGLHAWAVYSIGGLVLAYFGFRRGQPYLPGAPLRAVFTGAWVKPVAGAADLIGVLAVAAGVAGSVGMGIFQLESGLGVVLGVPTGTLWVPVLILVTLFLAYMASATTGLDKGIKWLSNINMATAVLLMVFLVLAGPTSFLLDVCVTAAGDYVAALPTMSLRLFPFRDLDAWTSGWTLTYFIWWIAWAPFVGVFIARISRGRTIREYVVGVTLAPTVFSVLWFGVFGGTGIYEELHGAGGVADLVSEDVTTALFALYERIPLTAVLSGVTIGLLFIFLVTSCDSATYVLGMLTSGGALVPPTRRKILWGVAIAALGAALMLTGNIEVLKAVVVTGAVPFAFVMLLQVVALLRALGDEKVPRARGGRRGSRAGAVALVLVAPLLQGCGDETAPLRIGIKSFAEQVILGQMVHELCEEARIPVAPLVECGDTYGCQAALRGGDLDLVVEYSGTALLFAGEDLRDGDAGVDRARALYQSWDLEWLEPLGLDNSYLLAMRADRAMALQVRSLADLALLDTPLRITLPGEYLHRTADGLAPLSRRYGLRTDADPLVREDPAARLQALLDGRADVAVLYATDGVMTDPRIVALADPLGFFPPYEAAILIRRGALTRHEGLLDTLTPLSGRVSNPAMRELNFAVQQEGRSPESVARAFLVGAELVAGESGGTSGIRAMALGVHAEDSLEAPTATALSALRSVYAGRSVHAEASLGPLLAIRTGDARLAVAGGERFFRRDGSGTVRREEGIEAVAVVGHRSVHVLRRAGDLPADPLRGRIGIPSAGGRARVAEDMLAAAGLVATASRGSDELLSTLSEGGLDAVILVAEQGDATVSGALARRGLALADLEDWLTPTRAADLPYLRPGRRPPGPDPPHQEPPPPLDIQVLLVGPAPAAIALGRAGPAAAIGARGQPLDRATALDLADAAGHLEAPDAALPSTWRRVATPGDPGGNRGTVDTLLNLFAFAFLGWLGWLVTRRPTAENAQ